MIQEIINFVETLPNEVFTNNLQPKEGLYIVLDIDKNGNAINSIKEDLVGKFINGYGGIYDEDLSILTKEELENTRRIKVNKTNRKKLQEGIDKKIKLGQYIDGSSNLFEKDLSKTELLDLKKRYRKKIDTANIGDVLPNFIAAYVDKKDQMPDLVKEYLPFWMNTVPVSPAKIFNPINKVFGNTCSPFAFSFNKKNWEKYDLYNLYLAATKELEGTAKEKALGKLQSQPGFKKIAQDLYPLKAIPSDSIRAQLNAKFHHFMRGELTIYFDKAEEYLEEDVHLKWLMFFRNYLYKNIFKLIDSLERFDNLKSAQAIYLFLKAPSLEDYKKPYQKYLSEKVFNKDDYNKIKPSTEEVYGISDSTSYFNDKKPFLKHLSAPILYNYRITGESAMRLWQFYNLQRNKQLPNPMPIFVDKKELTESAIKLFNDEKGKLGYVELIRRLLEKGEDLSNYYLIFFDARAKKSKIIDVDFVSNFRYEIQDVKIHEVFSLGGHLAAKTIVKDIFDFEYKVINLIFNSKLIVKDGKWRKYFDDLESKYYTSNNYNQLLKYRKAIYDYVFKSRRQAISSKIFNDIMLKGILDDIRLNEDSTNDYSIKAKLNIWFSLYEYFDYLQFNKPLNKKSMVNKTEELMSRISTIATNEQEHLQNDDEFAFAAGQIIHYLLNKSEAGNRTHALLEPFLQKTDATLLKREIARCFDMYKHAIKFYARKYEFDKIMSEVMGYEPDEKNMKNLLPSTLAGYFAKSTFAKKKED